jgi:hypothetical protein
MIDDPVLNTILDNTYTKADLIRRMRFVRSFLEYSFFTDTGQKTIGNYLKSINASKADIEALNSYPEKFYQSFTRLNVYKIFKESVAKLKDVPTVTVYLPEEPEDEAIDEMGKWFRSKLESRVLLDIRHDPNKIGGCAITLGGKYRDYSLHYFVQKKKDTILDILKNYG